MTLAPIGAADNDLCSKGADHCITCRDQGVPMRVLHSLPDGLAICETVAHLAEREEVAIDLVGPVASGDQLLVHARVAIARLPVPPRDWGAAA